MQHLQNHNHMPGNCENYSLLGCNLCFLSNFQVSTYNIKFQSAEELESTIMSGKEY